MPGKLTILPPEVGTRLKKLRENLGLTQIAFSELVGVTQATLSRMERGQGAISAEVIYGILCNWPHTDVYNLLCGSPSLPMADDQPALAVAANVRPIIRVMGDALDDLPSDGIADDYLAVPLLDGKVAAGPGCFVWEQVESLVWVYRPEIGHHRKLIAVKVAGDSMLPTIPDGAIVIIDIDRRDPRGDRRNIWAIRTDRDGSLAIKRLQATEDPPGFIVLSDNFALYPPKIAWTREPNELVVGKVIWMWRSLD